ncbi:MAG: 4a-hydroxytetrahydrobiopterin dehydratase [Patescibacteria group bacterium]
MAGRDLASMRCVPCQGGVLPLKGDELQSYYRDLDNDWEVVEEHHLKKRFTFPDFKTALAFVNKVGAMAEEIGHHPEISFGWGFAEIQIYTHKINGLHEADFVFAAKISQSKSPA